MVLLATPSRNSVEATFAYDLVQLVQHTKDVVFSVALGSHLPNLRTELAKRSSSYSHILFLDSDMRFPPDTLERLLKHDLDFVGANCKQRAQDQWTARKDDSFVSSTDNTGLAVIDSLGFGVTLIKSDVFKKIPEPWFAMPFDGNRYVGEDVFFCHQLKEAGVKLYIDHDLSQIIKHTGSKEY